MLEFCIQPTNSPQYTFEKKCILLYDGILGYALEQYFSVVYELNFIVYYQLAFELRLKQELELKPKPDFR